MAVKKKSTRKYGPKASEAVEQEMHEFKRGTLKSGGSGRTVKNPKQAIAIALSEARKEGAKVPKKKAASKKKSAAKTTPARKTAAKKPAKKKSATKKAGAKKSAGRKKSAKKSSSR